MDYIIDKNDLIDCNLLFAKNIEIPQNITTICTGVFYSLDNIETIHMHNNLKTIEEMVFQGCINLKKIHLSENLIRLGNYSFAQCKKIEEIIIPPKIRTLEIATFEDCDKLKHVKLPKNLIRISDRTFFRCLSLEEIELPSTLEYIGTNVFHHCVKLKNIKIPEKIKVINEGTFSECHLLENIYLSDNITQINDTAFYNCVKLKNVILPQYLTKIGALSFANCYSLTHIEIPIAVKNIEQGAFSECHNLSEIILNEGLETISPFAFFYCKKLRKINIPSTVKIIDNQAFSSCIHLEEITIPNSVERLGEKVFDNCPNLTKITIENVNLFKNKSLDYNLEQMNHIYINNDGKIILSSLILKDTENYTKIDMEVINHLMKTYGYTKSEALLLTLRLPKKSYDDFLHIKNVLPMLLEYYDLNGDEYLKISNHDHLNSLLKRIKKMDKTVTDEEEIFKITKFAISLGVLNENKIERQKASEFLATSIQQGILKINRIHDIFKNFNPVTNDKKQNKEWADFIMYKDNFKLLLKLENKEPGIISYIYDNFYNIKEYGRKSKGKQQHRKITLEMCLDFHSQIYFKGSDVDDMEIASELSKYSDTKKQKYFDLAIQIKKDYNKLKQEGMIKDSILSKNIVENDIFKQIEMERKNLISNINDLHNSLDKIANKRFTYELLSKEDPRNYTLGKYCSCCAHIAGAGYSIMRASILHPNCQNIVIKDTGGKIIAKSTVYVNVEQRYAVCNTISVNENIDDSNSLDEVYKKILSAVDAFATQYNIENPNQPIKQINVGVDYNTFFPRLKEEGEKADTILEGIHFSQYGKIGQNHNDDWLNGQYVIWKDKTQGGRSNGK